MTHKPVVLVFYRKNFNFINLFLIIALGLFVYRHLSTFSFVIGWDDQTFVTNQYTEDGLLVRNILAILSEFYHWQYAPINQLYYSTIYELVGYNATYFHLTSLAVHIVNSVLVYSLISVLCGKLFLLSPMKNALIGLITSLLFCTAPVNLEPVAWVAASKVLLYGMFYLFALISYAQYLSTKKPFFYYLVVVSFVLSFGAKEQAVTLCFCMLLFDFIYQRNFKDTLVWLEKLPIFTLSILFGTATIESQGDAVFGAGGFYSYTDRIFLFFYTASEYFTKIILPVKISYVYPYPFQIGQKPPIWLWIYPIVIPLIIICLKRYFIKRWIFFGFTFFLIHIIIVSNIFSLARNSAIADRYAYLSSVGIFFLVAVCLTKAIGIIKFRKYSYSIATTYICCICIYTTDHSLVWQNSLTLKQEIRNTIKKRNDYKQWLKNRDDDETNKK